MSDRVSTDPPVSCSGDIYANRTIVLLAGTDSRRNSEIALTSRRLRLSGREKVPQHLRSVLAPQAKTMRLMTVCRFDRYADSLQKLLKSLRIPVNDSLVTPALIQISSVGGTLLTPLRNGSRYEKVAPLKLGDNIPIFPNRVENSNAT
jgi:hypothetical protein